jgi:cell volume regulation protein A
MMGEILLPAILIALFLTFVGRPLAVALLMKPQGCSNAQIALVSWAGLRGASSIVFAIMATVSPTYLKNDLFHIVFCVVLLSIAFQGTLLPFVAHRLKMVDPSADVLRTFNDYQEEHEVQFVRLRISEKHPWRGKKLWELTLPPEMLIVSIQRGTHIVIPNGSDTLELGDRLVITAPAFRDNQKIDLREMVLPPDHDWCDHALRDIDLPRGTLIVLSRHAGVAIVPRGDTILRAGDTVVMTEIQA